MKKYIVLFQAAMVSLITLAPAPVHSRESAAGWSLQSPDRRCEISVMLDRAGGLSYQVRFGGKLVVQKSPLGLRRDDGAFVNGLVLRQAGEVESRREQYELFAGVVPRVDHLLDHRKLTFQNASGFPLEIELAAANEGVAFRYSFPGETGSVHSVQAELTGFAVPPKTRGWLQPYHAAGPYTPAYEDFYFHVSPGEPPPRSRQEARGWAFPALFEVPAASAWALVTESGNDGSYCASHLSPDSSNGVYRIAFALGDEGTKGWTNRFGPEPRATLPWTMPWRVIILGKSAADIATATLVTDLAPRSRIADTSWIKPGRASWSWWAHPSGPNTPELFNQYTDFAAKMKWEYTLFDAGWRRSGLKEIAGHAHDVGVQPLAWLFASDFYDEVKRTNRLDQMCEAGVRGVKVDFWCSDRQEAIAAMQALFEEATERKMVVNLHGCTLPRGWNRTWPNFLAAEAVLGSESYMFEPRYTEKAAELSTVLPFTRNVAGPMDFTPVACSTKKFPRQTTAAHELALAIIFTSGIIHYADSTEFFESLGPEALQILRDAPAQWDETRCLVGDPGRAVVFARRSRDSWFIAGANGTEKSLPLNLDLALFKDFKRRLLVAEATNRSMQVATTTVAASKNWRHDLPPGGGFILRLDK